VGKTPKLQYFLTFPIFLSFRFSFLDFFRYSNNKEEVITHVAINLGMNQIIKYKIKINKTIRYTIINEYSSEIFLSSGDDFHIVYAKKQETTSSGWRQETISNALQQYLIKIYGFIMGNSTNI
jgi:hypothetical protein